VQELRLGRCSRWQRPGGKRQGFAWRRNARCPATIEGLTTEPALVTIARSQVTAAQQQPFRSAIPEAHPYKAAIEEACQELLDKWGSEWFIAIALEERGKWGICVGRRRPTRTYVRTSSPGREEQNPKSVGKWLREASRQIRQESELQFGMVPLGDLSETAASELVDLVGLYGGRLHPDGWITLADEKAWPAFLRRVEGLGVTLAASVREA